MPFIASANYLGMEYLGDVHTWIDSDLQVPKILEPALKEFVLNNPDIILTGNVAYYYYLKDKINSSRKSAAVFQPNPIDPLHPDRGRTHRKNRIYRHCRHLCANR